MGKLGILGTLGWEKGINSQFSPFPSGFWGRIPDFSSFPAVPRWLRSDPPGISLVSPGAAPDPGFPPGLAPNSQKFQARAGPRLFPGIKPPKFPKFLLYSHFFLLKIPDLFPFNSPKNPSLFLFYSPKIPTLFPFFSLKIPSLFYFLSPHIPGYFSLKFPRFPRKILDFFLFFFPTKFLVFLISPLPQTPNFFPHFPPDPAENLGILGVLGNFLGFLGIPEFLPPQRF